MEKKIDYKAALENESLGMGIGSKVKATPQKLANELTGAFEEIQLPSGHLTPYQLDAMLNTIPMELTFIDENSVNRYFNDGDDMKLFKSTVDDSGAVKKLGYIQKTYELRNRDCHNQAGSPELLEPDALFVDEHCNCNSKEIIDEGCKQRPYKGPQQNSRKGCTKAALTEGEELLEVLKSNPGKELGGCLVRRVIVSKSDAYHENNWQHSEGKYACHRKCQKCFIKIRIEQG